MVLAQIRLIRLTSLRPAYSPVSVRRVEIVLKMNSVGFPALLPLASECIISSNILEKSQINYFHRAISCLITLRAGRSFGPVALFRATLSGTAQSGPKRSTNSFQELKLPSCAKLVRCWVRFPFVCSSPPSRAD